VENDAPEARGVLRAARALTGHALVVGVTGAPGAGKSTLVGAYVAELRRRDLSVGVLAVDPSSPLTGGALLGDRIRMLTHAGDPGVFVRSLASRGHLGGLARSAGAVVDVMDAAGRDVVVVETVGVGQSEIEVTDLADIRVVVWAPGAGDDVQAAKAGILEIADVLVVNKAD
jgi:LAO/AO transport system kinase